METIRKFFVWTKSLPIWVRIIVYILVMALSFLFSVYPFTSCGITQSTVNNIQSNDANIEMTVDPTQSSNTTVSTDATLTPNIN